MVIYHQIKNRFSCIEEMGRICIYKMRNQSITRRERRNYAKVLDRRATVLLVISLAILVFFMTAGHSGFRRGIIVFFKFRKLNSDYITNILHNKMEFIGTAVWTLTTILSAFIVLYYSTQGSRNLGLTNRKIIAYTYGTYYIPLLVCVNAMVVVMMTYHFYIAAYTKFYLLAAYSCFLQSIVMTICIYSTTYKKAFQTIIQVERNTFYEWYKYTLSEFDKLQRIQRSKDYIKLRHAIAQKKEQLPFHINNIMRWDEPLSEKQDIIWSILVQPFGEKYKDVIRYPEILYMYHYRNFRVIVDYMKGLELDKTINVQENHDLYNIFYRFVFEIEERSGGDDLIEKQIYISCSALFNALIAEKALFDRWSALIYIISNVTREKRIKQTLLLLLLLIIQFQLSINNIDIDDLQEMIILTQKIREMPEHSELKKNYLKNFNQNQEFFEKLVLIWIEDSTEGRQNQFFICDDILRAIRGEGRFDVISFILL